MTERKKRAAPDGYEILRNPHQRKVIEIRADEMVRAAERVRMVIFLANAATPLAVLLKTLWPRFFPDKPLPEIEFLDIGTEKIKILKEYAVENGFYSPGTPVNTLVSSLIRSQQDLERIFGAGNVSELLRILKPAENECMGERLIVDVSRNSGSTLMITRGILGIVDPGNSYLLFILLEKPEYTLPFQGMTNTPLTPWGRLAAETGQDPASFVMRPPEVSCNRRREDGARRELRRLAEEIRLI